MPPYATKKDARVAVQKSHWENLERSGGIMTAREVGVWVVIYDLYHEPLVQFVDTLDHVRELICHDETYREDYVIARVLTEAQAFSYGFSCQRNLTAGEEIDLDNPPVEPPAVAEDKRVTITFTYDPDEIEDVALRHHGPLDDLAAAAAEAAMRELQRLFTAAEYQEVRGDQN